MLYLSGVADVDGETLAVRHADFESQARAAVSDVTAVLASVGASLGDVVRVECFLTRASDFPAWNQIWTEAFAHPRPARTTVVCGTVVEGILIELQVTAHRRAG